MAGSDKAAIKGPKRSKGGEEVEDDDGRGCEIEKERERQSEGKRTAGSDEQHEGAAEEKRLERTIKGEVEDADEGADVR